jgi:hypothetical protein
MPSRYVYEEKNTGRPVKTVAKIQDLERYDGCTPGFQFLSQDAAGW